MSPSPRRYLFFVSHLYSLSILRPLQKEARRRGEEVAWYLEGPGEDYLRPDEIRLHSIEEAKAYPADASFAPGYWIPDFFPGIKVQVFHGLETKRTGHHFRIRGLFDLYGTHGPHTTPRFEKPMKRLGYYKVVETGWPKLDPLFDGSTRSWREDHPTDRPIVLYASTFTKAMTSAPYLLDTIRELSEKGEWHWLVTLHPKHDPETADRYRALAGPHLTFVETDDVLPLLAAADVMLCDTSSISFEFLLLDKPVVTYRNYTPGPHLMDVRSIEDIEPALRRALDRPRDLMEKIRAFGARIHPYRDGRSSQRLLDAVAEFLEHDAGRMKPKPLNLLRRLKIRKRMGYYRWA